MFKKDVKVAFNWIGPRGPIPNTEVPSILHLAAVAESGRIVGSRTWLDSLWHLLFCNQPGYDISPTNFLGLHDPFIFPMALYWRVPFGTYFYYGSGLLEYSDISDHTLNHMRVNMGFLLIEHSAETAIEHSHLHLMNTYFTSHGIPQNKIFYLTGCANGPELYEWWCMKEGISDPRNKMNIIPYPISQQSLALSYFDFYKPKEPEYDSEKIPQKLFLSWNRRFRPHRVALAVGLEKNGLIDRSYVSMSKNDPEQPHLQFPEMNPYYISGLEVTEQDRINLINKLPLVLDGETDNNRMCQDFDDANRPYYQDSLVSLVTETNFDALEVSLTEKSYKPMKEKHPFIIVGAPGVLRCLKNWGYKTFGEFWDESYDNENDPRNRMRLIIETCKDIASWDNEKIKDFRRRVKPILDHNYQLIKIPPSTTIAKQIRERMFEVLSEKYGTDI